MFRNSESTSTRATIISAGSDRVHSWAHSHELADVLDGDLGGARLFQLPNEASNRLVSIAEPRTLGAELLRALAIRLWQVRNRRRVKKLLIASMLSGEGKTVVAANLAVSLALHDSRVLLIDGDLRRASLSQWFQIAEDNISDGWQRRGEKRMPILRKAEGLPLWVLPAGSPVAAPGEQLQSADFARRLAALETDVEWIIFDSTPLIPFGDATILANLADAIVLVTRSGVTPKDQLAEIPKILDPAKIIATLVNCADVTAPKYYESYYARYLGASPSTRSQ